MSVIDQKEYLKRYLSGGSVDGKKKKRKKKKPTAISDRVKIIDDDIDISQLTSVQEAVDLLGTNEDAPQVVGVIDERPLHLRIDDYRKGDLWKPIGAAPQTSEETTLITNEPQKDRTATSKSDADYSPPRRKRRNSGSPYAKADGDSSPPRRKSSRRGSDSSPPRKTERDNSPPRRKRRNSSSPPMKADGDSSPPRRKSSRRDSDNSPPRKTDRDSSPPKRNRRSSDSSPPRRKADKDSSPPRKRSSRFSDNSPPRKTDRDSSPPKRNRRSSDSSPPRRKTDKDSSPPRKRISRFSDNSPPRKTERDSSPPRRSAPQKPDEQPKRKLLPGNSKGKYLIPAKRKNTTNDDKMTKTLDGKTAGLQNAKELVKETEAFQKREEELFKNMSADVSGVNSSAVLRDRKTGKIRDLKKEAEERKEKEEREAEAKEKYTRWGRGLKQVEDYEDKLAQDLHEMSKPLARYADDEDLDKYLKAQERAGDPMLEFIKKKKGKHTDNAETPSKKPRFQGEFMPNRFGIVPGHRWDGVDRSSGYEKKWFEVQNSKRAEQEEVYKWSTEDM